MKKMTVFILSAVMLLSCLTGCKQHEIPAQASEAATTAPAATTPYQTPERYTGSWSGVEGFVNVTADALVDGPGDAGFPVAKVKRHKFTLEDAGKLKEVFLQGSTLYQIPKMTRQQAEETLEHFRAIQRGEEESDGNKPPQMIADTIAEYEQLVKTLPEVPEQIPADAFVSTREGWEGFSELTGKAQIGDEEVVLSIENYDDNSWTDRAVFVVMPYSGYVGSLDTIQAYRLAEYPYPTDVKLCVEEAIQTGADLLEQLGLTGMVCFTAEPVAFVKEHEEQRIMDTGYELEFVRTVQGIPLNQARESSYTFPGGIKMHTQLQDGSCSDGSGAARWWNERIRIRVGSRGIVMFEWVSPYEEPELVTEQAELLDFESVCEIFEKMIMVRYDWVAETNRENSFGYEMIYDLNVDSVKLSLMRVREKGNPTESTIVPVWDFWGTEKTHTDHEDYKDRIGSTSYKPLLTINALDGSIIDRELGY